MRGFLGIAFLLTICFCISENKKKINYKEVLICLCSQFILAFLFQKAPFIKDIFLKITGAVMSIKTATDAGSRFVFGYLGGGASPFPIENSSNLFIFAFQALPMIIVISALSMLLFHWGILQKVVHFLSKALGKLINIGGALCVAASAKLFIGQTEAPLLVRPYLAKFTRSELLTIMTCGLATTSGSVLILYGLILEKTIPNSISHIFTVTIISIPIAIAISRMIIPALEGNTEGKLEIPYKFTNSMDAVARGTTDGLSMVLNVAAMVLVMLALVELVNIMLGALPDIQGTPITLQRIFGLILAPITYLMGIPWSESFAAGNVLGSKIVLNEIVAFLNLSALPPESISEKSKLIMSYALCGFANFSSVGIIIGTYSNLVPERRSEVISLCLRALIGGIVSTCISGSVIGIICSL